MSLFSKLSDSYQYHKTPVIKSVETNFTSKNFHTFLYLNINSKDIIDEFCYEFKGEPHEQALFEALGNLVTGLDIEKARQIDIEIIDEMFEDSQVWQEYRDSRIFYTPLKLFFLAIDQFKGKLQAPVRGSQLICRCFGITENQIVKAIQENKLKDLKELTGTTLAGGGCTNCTVDLQEYLLEFAPIQKNPRKIRGRSKAKFILELFEDLEKWKISQGLNCHIDIFDCSEELLTLSDKSSLDETQKELLEQYLQNQYQLQLKLN